MGDLRQHVVSLECELTSVLVERTVRGLLLQRKDESRGVGALGLVVYLLGDLAQRGEEIDWAYARLKPALLDAVERVPALRFLDAG